MESGAARVQCSRSNGNEEPFQASQLNINGSKHYNGVGGYVISNVAVCVCVCMESGAARVQCSKSNGNEAARLLVCLHACI